MIDNINKPELLAPVGNSESFEAALYFGADAVYCGGRIMQLRALCTSFNDDELEAMVKKAHSVNKKVYVTVNSFANDSDLDNIPEYIQYLYSIGVNAIIVSDLGVLATVKSSAPNMAVHISTQANCMNSQAAIKYYENGATRIVLARELTLQQIAELRTRIPNELELEAFVHGAMCMSYSGRCLISSYLTSRSANKGLCTQPCRWEYYLTEKTRSGTYIPVIEEDGATAILSSHDLNCIEFLDDIKNAGVCSFKIEGRMKTAYYTSTVVNAYRKAIDKTVDINILKEELEKVSHRPYETGFYYNRVAKHNNNDAQYHSKANFIAAVLSHDESFIRVQMRNRFEVGDTLEILSPILNESSFVVTDIIDANGNNKNVADLPMEELLLSCPYKLNSGDILRKSN